MHTHVAKFSLHAKTASRTPHTLDPHPHRRRGVCNLCGGHVVATTNGCEGRVGGPHRLANRWYPPARYLATTRHNPVCAYAHGNRRYYMGVSRVVFHGQLIGTVRMRAANLWLWGVGVRGRWPAWAGAGCGCVVVVAAVVAKQWRVGYGVVGTVVSMLRHPAVLVWFA